MPKKRKPAAKTVPARKSARLGDLNAPAQPPADLPQHPQMSPQPQTLPQTPAPQPQMLLDLPQQLLFPQQQMLPHPLALQQPQTLPQFALPQGDAQVAPQASQPVATMQLQPIEPQPLAHSGTAYSTHLTPHHSSGLDQQDNHQSIIGSHNQGQPIPIPDILELWDLAKTPIKCDILDQLLLEYPPTDIAIELSHGFRYGFPLHYHGPRYPILCKNLISATENPEIIWEKLGKEITEGRMLGPFPFTPISNLRCSPIGLTPKRTGGFRLITHLSYPRGNSVNDFIDPSLASVQYSSFDKVVNIVRKSGTGALMAKMDISSAFRLLPVYPGDFDLLGIYFQDFYIIDKAMPFGCSISCATFEKFASFLDWKLKQISNSSNLDHYLDDFFFAGKQNTNDCQYLMNCFTDLCARIGVPLADEKTVGPCTCLSFLGLTINSLLGTIQIPQEKVDHLYVLINEALNSKKVTLKQLQSLVGSLAFCARALPSARAFNRRMYTAFGSASRPHHHIRLTKGIKQDLHTWLKFLSTFNGHSYIQDANWLSNIDLELFTDSAGGSLFGGAAYFQGKWAFIQWPSDWQSRGLLTDVTFLELIPIFLAVYLWAHKLANKRILFHTDNMALVYILNQKTAKSDNVMHLLRQMILLSLRHNFNFKATHIPGQFNEICDSISRKKWQLFRKLAPEADMEPTPIPPVFWELLLQK